MRHFAGASRVSGRGDGEAGGLDRLGREHVLDGHGGRSEDAGLPAGLRGDDAQVLGRQGQGTLVDDFADAGQQVLTGRGDADRR